MKVLLLFIGLFVYTASLSQIENGGTYSAFNFQHNNRLLKYTNNPDTMLIVNNDTVNRVDKHGQKQGIWKVKYSNGRNWQAHFINDTLQGKFDLFDADGSRILSGMYKDGLKTGTWHWDLVFAGKDSAIYSRGEEREAIKFVWDDSLFKINQSNYLIPYGYSFIFHKWFNDTIRDSELLPLLDLLKQNRNLSIELVANTGIEQANYPMYSTIYSLKLVKYIYNYLVDSGIEKQRISYRTNEDSRFVFLIPEDSYENLFNRRVDIRITGVD